MVRRLRGLLVRYARGGYKGPQPGNDKLIILLTSAWGMGGTIRAALNLAGHMADHRDVEIISIWRRREQPFFGEHPPGVRVTPLNDEREKARPKGVRLLAYRSLTRVRSVLMHPSDRTFPQCSLWTDIQLVRQLRGKQGWLMATRPGWNLIAGLLQPPGLTTIGLEQMHLDHHSPPLKQAMRSEYPKLDCFVVLTEGQRERYEKHVKRPMKRIEVIPNTVAASMEGPPADLSSKTIFTAGRLFDQKGFDFLIEAYAPVAERFPDWRLRICGQGPRKAELEAQIERLDLGHVISLEPPTKQIGKDMSEASIFVLSSRFEGFPLILLEAMSKRMAVVAYDCPTGPADIIDDHRNGLLVPPKDVPGLTAALLEMMGDEDLRRRCAPAAEATAENFKMHSIGPRWDALLDDLR